MHRFTCITAHTAAQVKFGKRWGLPTEPGQLRCTGWICFNTCQLWFDPTLPPLSLISPVHAVISYSTFLLTSPYKRLSSFYILSLPFTIYSPPHPPFSWHLHHHLCATPLLFPTQSSSNPLSLWFLSISCCQCLVLSPFLFVMLSVI